MPDESAISPIRVFISYSHDSDAHCDSVWDLSERLLADGVDCRLDQQKTSPPEGWPRWCANQIKEAKYVLTICTPGYRRRYEGGEEEGIGLGANWEGFVITQALYDGNGRNERFIPVVLSSDAVSEIPTELRPATHYDLSATDGYVKLLRHLTNQPERMASPVAGRVPSLPPLKRKVASSGSPWTSHCQKILF